jgi:hypothetical protein
MHLPPGKRVFRRGNAFANRGNPFAGGGNAFAAGKMDLPPEKWICQPGN